MLEKLRTGEPLTAKDKVVHEHGLVSVLRELHDDLDRAVFDAHGWNDLAAELVGRPGATTPLPDKPAALSRDDIAASFTARGRWRERLDPLLEMLVVLGKARLEAGEVLRYRRGG